MRGGTARGWTIALLLSVATSAPRELAGEATLELDVQTAKEVMEGDPETSSVDAQGRITVGPVITELSQGVDRPIVSMVALPDGSIYAGTAGAGILKLDPKGEGTRVTEAELVVSALAFHHGTLYAGTSPGGRLLTLTPKGAEETLFEHGGKYVWSLLGDGDSLIAATGEPGRVLRVWPKGKSEVLLDPGETHIRALAHHPRRGIIAGSGQKGIVYQIDGKSGRAYALYDSSLEEVTALAVDPSTGDLYVALVSETKPASFVPAKWIGPVKGDETEEKASPIKGSEVVRIAHDGRVDLLWNSKTEGALALSFDASEARLYVATGAGPKGRGRIYAIDTRDRDRLLLIARIEPPNASVLIHAPTGGALLVGTSPAGRVLRVGPGPRREATYFSAEQDLTHISAIGRVWFDADVPEGARVRASLRTGNTAEADATWSEWSKPVDTRDGANIEVPRARYAQFRVVLEAAPNGAAPVVKSLHASVARMNVAPIVEEIFVLRRGVYMVPLPPEDEKEKTVTLSESALRDLRGAPADTGERPRVRQGTRDGMLTVAWTAQDPNGDGLLYRLELARIDGADTGYRLVADDLEAFFWTFDGRAYPDGRYRFRVTASDRPSNPPNAMLADAFESERFLIDNTSPRLVELAAKSPRRGVIGLSALAADEISRIQRAEISLDGGPWLMFPAADGLLDGLREPLALELVDRGTPGSPSLEAGRHTIAVRVEDEAGNVAAGATAVVVP